MKRIKFVSLLTAACIMGTMISACSGGKTVESDVPETTVTETTAETEETSETKISEPKKPGGEKVPLETTAEIVETTVAEKSTVGEPIEINEYLSYCKYIGEDASVLFPDEEYYYDIYMYIPYLTFKGGEVDEINKQMLDYAIESHDQWWTNGCDFRVFINDDNSISIIQFVYGMSDYLDVNAIMVDLNTGKIMSNEEILERSGYTETELYEYATATMTSVLEADKANHDISDEIFEQMMESESMSEAYEYVFSPDNINTDMIMFIGPEGKLVVSAAMLSFGSSATTTEIFDLEGNLWTAAGCGYMDYNFGDIVIYARGNGTIIKK